MSQQLTAQALPSPLESYLQTLILEALTDIITLTVSGIGTSDTPDVTYTAAQGTVTGASANPAEDQTIGTTDNAPPRITAASVDSDSIITITYSEDIDISTTDGAGFSLSVGVVSANSDPGGSSSIITLTVSGITTSDTPDVTYSESQGTVITDASLNFAENETFVGTTDNAPPRITAASVDSDSTITITYSEDVDVTATDGAGFSLSVGTISANSDPGGSSGIITLTVSGITTSDTPDVTYSALSGSVEDVSSNPAEDQTIGTTDNAPPRITAASVDSASTITITYSEDVDVTATDGAGFSLSVGTISANSDPGGLTDIITLTVSGITTSDTPDVTYSASSGSVEDVSSNPAEDQTIGTTDNAPPRITAASVDSDSTITITYSEDVDVTATDGAGFSLSVGTISANSDPGGSSDIITLTVSGITTSDTPDVTYSASSGSVEDVSSNPAEDQTIGTTDNAPPTILSIGTASTTTINLILSEEITLNSAAPGDFVLTGDITTTPTVNAITANDGIVTLSLSDSLDMMILSVWHIPKVPAA